MQRIFQRRKHGNILGKEGSVVQHLVLKTMEKQLCHLCVMLSKDKDRCPLWLAPQPPHFQQVLRYSQALPRIIWKCLLHWLYFICSPIQVLTRPNLAWFLISQNSELLLLILLLLLCIQSSLAIDFLTFFLHIYNVQWCLQWISCMINSIHDSFEQCLLNTAQEVTNLRMPWRTREHVSHNSRSNSSEYTALHRGDTPPNKHFQQVPFSILVHFCTYFQTGWVWTLSTLQSTKHTPARCPTPRLKV